MNDKIYETAKWIAIGILVGYFSKYALNWIKTWKQKDPEKTQETELNN